MVTFSLTYPPTPALNNREQNLNIFLYSRIISDVKTGNYPLLEEKCIPPIRIISRYIEALLKYHTNSKSLIMPKMTYLITFLDNNGKSDIYTGGIIFMDSIII